jgi:hypothetical protein
MRMLMAVRAVVGMDQTDGVDNWSAIRIQPNRTKTYHELHAGMSLSFSFLRKICITQLPRQRWLTETRWHRRQWSLNGCETLNRYPSSCRSYI